MDVNYCPKCATPLISKRNGDRERPTCPECGFVFYFNPVVGAGALVETEGRVVLVRRGVEPKAGLWCLPSGYVEADELVEQAVVREMKEETGLEVEIDDMLGVYSFGREPQTGVLVLYAAHTVGGELQAGDDAAEVGLFAPDELPSEELIAFGTHLQALRDWRRARAIVYQPATITDRQPIVHLTQRSPEIGDEPLAYLEGPNQQVLLAWDRNLPVGLACLDFRQATKVVEISQVYVHPNYRRWGIATRLVNLGISCAQEQGAHTLLAEAPITNAVVLVYLKAGFRVSGFIDAHYPPGSEAPTNALFLAYSLD
jgi:8-oxo-dGTP diphosphatase